jgi:hypothetical protein
VPFDGRHRHAAMRRTRLSRLGRRVRRNDIPFHKCTSKLLFDSYLKNLAAMRQKLLTSLPQRVIFSPDVMPHSGMIAKKTTGNAGARQKGTGQ